MALFEVCVLQVRQPGVLKKATTPDLRIFSMLNITFAGAGTDNDWAQEPNEVSKISRAFHSSAENLY